MIVLCGSMCNSLDLRVLRTAGARLASLDAIESSAERILIAEGDREVIRELCRLAESEKRRLIEIRPSSKALYMAGIHLAKYLILPSVAGAVASLRCAGFSRPEATSVVEVIGAQSLRAYSRAGHNWSRPVAALLRRAVECDVQAIQAADPRLAAIYAAGIEQALDFFEEPKKTRRCLDHR